MKKHLNVCEKYFENSNNENSIKSKRENHDKNIKFFVKRQRNLVFVTLFKDVVNVFDIFVVRTIFENDRLLNF